MTQIGITLNGEPRTLPAATTVAELVRQLELLPEQVAVERNQRLVRRADHAATELVEGDVLEIVTLVGGG